MDDDFPSVLRQMKRNNANVLVVGEFNSSICSLEEVRSMFAPAARRLSHLARSKRFSERASGNRRFNFMTTKQPTGESREF